jgi:DNA helicase-2/ATP-dependent DNA helicase PcrA
MLNSEQLQAVNHKKGPLLVIAGAGTGKTTVITERIKHLILEEDLNPAEILALTFTNKAAAEMEERVDVALPYGYTQMWILTFHAFCERVLRAEALSIGFNSKFKLLTQSEAIQFVRTNLFAFDLDYFRPLGNPTKFVEGMLQHFSRLQDEDIIPAEYLAWVKKQKAKVKGQSDKLEIKKWNELSKAYKKYDELKTKGDFLDFGDLITKTLLLFRQRPNVLDAYQKQFKYILVDEFQDTNIAQNGLVKLLANKGNITVVADDDQSIYKWRGAAVSNVLQFRQSFPKTKIITLTQNYRSNQTILDKAYALIQHNNPDRLEVMEKIDKKLVAVKKGQSQVGFLHTDRVENEAEAVAKKIKELVKSKKYKYQDFAILVRANNHAEPFSRALGRNAIPFQFLGPGRLFKQSEVMDLISYLKVLCNLEDSVSLYRLLAIDFFGIKPLELAKIGSFAKRHNLSLFTAAKKKGSIKVQKVLKIIEGHLKLVRKESAGQILYYFLERTGLLQNLISPQDTEAEKKAANIAKFFDKLKTYEIDYPEATVFSVVDWLELAQELGESPLAADIDWQHENAVNILTIHSAKGLEFKVVFLVNLVALRFPSLERREQIPIPESVIKEILPQGNAHLQEERRLFYVGMTRSCDQLFLTAADYYGEGKREKKLSPFIFEALGDEAVSAELQNPKPKPASFLSYNVPKTEDTKHKKSRLHIDYLSYSQIETFKTCPLHYRLRYLLQIPTPPSAPQSFGISLHTALKEAYLAAKKGEKISSAKFLKILREGWVIEGYTHKAYEEKMFVKAQKFLTEYWQKEFQSKKLPLGLEQSFVVPLPVSAGEQPLKIGGKIDRIDGLTGGKIEIIDYKTGANVPTQKQVDHDLQLTFYALAATSLRQLPFNKRPEDVLLTLYYFDTQTKISTQRTSKDLAQAKKEIFAWREKIEKSDFSCSGGYLCQNCEFKMFCKSEQE